MRHALRLALFQLPVLLLLTACEDGVLSNGWGGLPPEEGVPRDDTTTFTPDPVVGTGPGIRITGTVLARDLLSLVVETWPAKRLNSADLVLRIDPRARALVASMPGESWCGGDAPWQSTEDGGDWLFHRVPEADNWDCVCADMFPEPVGNFVIDRLEFGIEEPGTWRIDLEPTSLTPLCDCDQGCLSDVAVYGGTVHIAAP